MVATLNKPTDTKPVNPTDFGDYIPEAEQFRGPDGHVVSGPAASGIFKLAAAKTLANPYKPRLAIDDGDVKDAVRKIADIDEKIRIADVRKQDAIAAVQHYNDPEQQLARGKASLAGQPVAYTFPQLQDELAAATDAVKAMESLRVQAEAERDATAVRARKAIRRDAVPAEIEILKRLLAGLSIVRDAHHDAIALHREMTAASAPLGDDCLTLPRASEDISAGMWLDDAILCLLQMK